MMWVLAPVGVVLLVGFVTLAAGLAAMAARGEPDKRSEQPHHHEQGDQHQ